MYLVLIRRSACITSFIRIKPLLKFADTDDLTCKMPVEIAVENLFANILLC